MEVVLLGTGAADGWPNACCTCASCQAVRSTGDLRSPTSVLVDGTLLLDCGPDTARGAGAAGRTLAEVRHLLVTHEHPDHWDPAVLLWRRWAGQREPLQVLGPPGVVAAAEHWVAPGDPVRLRTVSPGEELDLDGHHVRALAGEHEVPVLLWDVTGPDGARLLYATDTGPLPPETLAALTGREYDLVLLELTFGERTDHGTGHLDLASFPAQLARLREVGAVTERTDVVAVHLGHHNPPPAALGRRLSAWGARVLPDGAVLPVGAPSPVRPQARAPHRTLVLGGARSGKSAEAERLLAAEPEVVYVATAGERSDDPEWAARVAAHRARRPGSWRTLESPDLVAVLAEPGPPLLVECLTLWLTGVLDRHRAWDGAAPPSVRTEVEALLAALRSTPRRVVLVSNEVGSGVVPATPSGRLFRDELGRLNAAVGAVCDDVRLVVAGRVLPLG
ncbi:MAG TPA: bifunctional adenosylcobinamide kinase/adenosylcobinamide-phosphate guanylyltransferase [Jiangellales bacterium]|nr:bifunctional adenosylcobinamide kinase/adenosylcobinamide-phosphate guanylyltransferase [Jiangellales bacterium]